ncbi:transcriptional regulator [Rhodococcus sp. SRB_17]|nr:transcriptional regulator [Rhodococcus sp. SRB_17]
MLGQLGDEWNMPIIRQALQGASKYGEFLAALPISNAVLTSRLSDLTRDGFLRREVYQTRQLRYEYLVTDKSRAVWPILLAIWEWERRWAAKRSDVFPAMKHNGCAQLFSPLLTCGECRATVSAKDVHSEWGPSGTWPRSVPVATTRRRSTANRAASESVFSETMTIFGNRWASAMIGSAFRGTTRFTDFESSLGAPPTIVADRLRSFREIGILEQVRNEARPDREDYRLTEKGQAFFPVVAYSLHWADRWFHSPDGRALILTHTSCGEKFTPTMVCDQCDGVLKGSDISVVPAG